MANKTQIIAEPGKQELFIIREFDAPRELVFKAHTDPEMYKRWLGPRDLTTELEVFEPRDGGRYRFINEDKDGNKYYFRGVFHEVVAPERVIGTFEYEGWPEKGKVEFDISKFEELPGGRTKLIVQAVYQSVEDRDGMIKSGMESGVNEGYEKLDELLAEKAAAV